jgi:hypothetical protein
MGAAIYFFFQLLEHHLVLPENLFEMSKNSDASLH